MVILGLSTFCDSSAAIVENGNIICAVEEERLNRIKHYEGMPWLAISECLEISNLSINDVDIVAVGWNPFIGWNTRIAETVKTILHTPGNINIKLSRGNGYLSGCRDLIKLRRSIKEKFPNSRNKQKIVFVNHHLSHAASAYFASPFENANIIIADGVGEYASVSFFNAVGNKLKRTGEIKFPNSLGHMYASVTKFLGFKPTSDEGKVMALASYGEDTYREIFERILGTTEKNKTIKLDYRLLDYHAARKGVFSKEFSRMTNLHPRKREDPITPEHMNLACSLQKHTERAVLFLLSEHFPENGKNPLCAAGGLFLNSVMNGEIVRNFNRRFFIQPAAGDNGVSVGAAFYADHAHNERFKRIPIKHVYLGRKFNDDNIQTALEEYSMKAESVGNISEITAKAILEGRVVGWFKGRMEFGPRALGNRSILGSPFHPGMKDLINLKIKNRESFRPFAASVLLEDIDEYFIGAQESPFMLKVFYFKEQYRELFPSINHIDYSCRIQTVERVANAPYYELLTEIKRRSGHGIVLNTSMNLAGEPIVNSPCEALNLFRKSNIDAIVLENYFISK